MAEIQTVPEHVTILISPSLIIAGIHQEGKLLGVEGYSIQAEKVSEDEVKVSREGNSWIYKLSDRVRWMEVN